MNHMVQAMINCARLVGRKLEGIQLKRRKSRRKREERKRAKSVWKST